MLAMDEVFSCDSVSWVNLSLRAVLQLVWVTRCGLL